MEIRIRYDKGIPFVLIIQDPKDRFLDMEIAIKECIDELAELVQSMKNEDMEGYAYVRSCRYVTRL